MLSALLATGLIGAAPARPCPAEDIRALTARVAAEQAPYRLTCFAVLPEGTRVTRRLLIEGQEAAGAGVDCRGAAIGRPGVPSSTGAPTVAIQSRREATGWSRPTGVHLKDCVVHGNVRIWGLGANGRIDDLRASSRTPGHTATTQAAAPSDIGFSNVRFVATGSIPLYVGPGVTGVTVRGGDFEGRSVSTAIYLDAESAGARVSGVDFDIRTGREQIAVDGSARNVIEGNRFVLRGRGGVFLYRNCGEDGVIRHQTPSDNRIIDNAFVEAAWPWPQAVVVGSRKGRRRYCRDDAGFPFGSSVDDGDRATGNVLAGNSVRYRWLPAWLQAGRGAVSTP